MYCDDKRMKKMIRVNDRHRMSHYSIVLFTDIHALLGLEVLRYSYRRWVNFDALGIKTSKDSLIKDRKRILFSENYVCCIRLYLFLSRE